MRVGLDQRALGALVGAELQRVLIRQARGYRAILEIEQRRGVADIGGQARLRFAKVAGDSLGARARGSRFDLGPPPANPGDTNDILALELFGREGQYRFI